MTAPTLSIPSSMAEITPAWLTAALREGDVIHGATVTAADFTTIGEGVGILGALARVKLTYDLAEDGAPSTLVAKLPTLDPGGRGIGIALGFYGKEIQFYRHLAAETPVRVPQLFYGAMDEASGQFCLLIEDLAGVPIGDQVAGCAVDEAKVVLEQLAMLHSSWWSDPRLAEFDWLPAADSPVQRFVGMAYAGAIGPFLERFGQRLTAEQRQLATDLGPKLNAIQDVFGARKDTLLHGDARLDNMFFGSCDGRAPFTLIDWQIAGIGPGPMDVAYFLSQSLMPVDRKLHEDSLVREYHGHLLTAKVSGYSWEQCWDDYRAAVLFCIAYPVIAGGSVDLANERGVALANAMTDRCFAANSELNTAQILARF